MFLTYKKTFYKFILTVMKLAQIQCSGTRIGIRWISGWFRGLVLLYIRSGFRISRSTSGFEKLLLQMLLLKSLKKLAIEVILFDRLLLVVFSLHSWFSILPGHQQLYLHHYVRSSLHYSVP